MKREEERLGPERDLVFERDGLILERMPEDPVQTKRRMHEIGANMEIDNSLKKRNPIISQDKMEKDTFRSRGLDKRENHVARRAPKPTARSRSEKGKVTRKKGKVYFLDLHEKSEIEMARRVLNRSGSSPTIVFTLTKEVTHILTRDERSWKCMGNRREETKELKGSGRASRMARVATEQVRGLPLGLNHAELCARHGMKVIRFEEIEKQSKKLDLQQRLSMEKGAAAPRTTSLVIEDLTGRFKPIVKELEVARDGRISLPYLDPEAAPGVCPFVFPGRATGGKSARRMKEKALEEQQTKRRRDSQGNKRLKWRISRAGYCEVCGAHYDEYSKHVEKPEHIEKKMNDPTNKLLDDLFVSLGPQSAVPLCFQEEDATIALTESHERECHGQTLCGKTAAAIVKSKEEMNPAGCATAQGKNEWPVLQTNKASHAKFMSTERSARNSRRPLALVNE